MAREVLRKTQRCVIKLGSALLTDADRTPDTDHLDTWVKQIAQLRAQSCECVVVTSGAVACGMQRLNWKMRPHALHELQALAAVGQMGLVQNYERAFKRHGLPTAQVLLTHDDLVNRERYLNARSTLRTLLKMGVVPIINENDTVSTEELHLSDNDTLAALVTNLVEAGLLIILTDQAGLHDQDPRHNKQAQLIREADAGDSALLRMAGSSGVLGRGGMRTKLLAAQKAARSGAATVIVNGHEQDIILRVIAGEDVGTLLKAERGKIAARKQWLASQLRVKGQLILDAGAVRVIRQSGKSLLPVGVKTVQGAFARGELVVCLDEEGNEVARGLVNYNADEARKIIGYGSDKIESLLGYVDEAELIHRDSLVLL